MNVYVVSECEWREGGSVIGAAVDRERAEKVGDQSREHFDPVAGWTPWKEEVCPADGSCRWTRSALEADGTVNYVLYQEIVVVPLDGAD